MNIQKHPDYHDGFFDAIDQAPDRLDGCSPEYRAGWDAAQHSKQILKSAGFSHDGRSFSAAGMITKDMDELATELSGTTPELSNEDGDVGKG